MSRLEELIQELCPNGVEFKPLNEIGIIFKGMSGVTNKWAETGNCRFIDYKNVYNHVKVDVCDLPFATVKKTENQIELKTGDILFTSASETPNECAISAVIEDKIINGIFLDDHLFGIRLDEENNPTFFNYYFRSSEFRKSINKTVRGVTRFYISMPSFSDIKVPVPPLEVQREIVRLLDDFTEKTEELKEKLSAEFTARKKQYEYYRDTLLNFNNSDNIKTLKLCEICKVYDGTHQTPQYTDSGIKFASVENIKAPYETKKHISINDYNKFKIKPQVNDVLMTRIGNIGTCYVVDKDEDLAYYVSLALLRPNPSVINSRYLKHYIESIKGAKELRKRTLINAVPIKINKDDIGKINITFPSLAEQERIVSILDRFDTLCNDISSGLPAEIEARQKQYKYYRDKLLTFKEMSE